MLTAPCSTQATVIQTFHAEMFTVFKNGKTFQYMVAVNKGSQCNEFCTKLIEYYVHRLCCLK